MIDELFGISGCGGYWECPASCVSAGKAGFVFSRRHWASDNLNFSHSGQLNPLTISPAISINSRRTNQSTRLRSKFKKTKIKKKV